MDFKREIHLLDLVQNDMEGKVLELIKSGDDIAFRIESKNTMYHHAALYESYNVLRVLIEHSNLDVNAKGDSGKTAFEMACYENKVDSCKILLTHPKFAFSKKLLEYVIKFSNLEILEAYLKKCPKNEEKITIEPGDIKLTVPIMELLVLYNHNVIIEISFDLVAIFGRINVGVEKFLEACETYLKVKQEKDVFIKQIEKKYFFREKSAGSLFTLCILEQDGYLSCKKQGKFNKFLEIFKKIPIEIQMLICNRCFDSSKKIIPSKYIDMELY